MITVLTDPVPVGRYYFTEFLKKLGRGVKQLINPRQSSFKRLKPKFRGHYAVTRSLIEGLEKIQYPYVYNPKRLKDVHEIVVVLSGRDALRQAIAWKREGRIDHLLAGPNLMILPSQYTNLWGSEVDLCLMPSQWISKVYQADLPSLHGRCAIWPAGVDTKYWKPFQGKVHTKIILFYVKEYDGPFNNINSYIKVVEMMGYKVEYIHAGQYSPEQYREALKRCEFMVGFSHVDSQSLAWAEAWAMDKPTLLWKNTSIILQGKSVDCSTAPWLTDSTGYFFSNINEFTVLFHQISTNQLIFTPRQWVIENMSDEVCAKLLLKLAFNLSS